MRTLRLPLLLIVVGATLGCVQAVRPYPIVCGTEELSFHFRTLGLGLFRSAFHDFLRIEFLSPDGDVALTLQQAAPVDSRTGIWALPMRMSRNWRRPDPVDPTNLAAEFRDVLISREPELLTLARRSG